MEDVAAPLSIAVIGASGDLARKKVIPALFALFSQGFLPPRFQVVGFARHPMNDDEFRAHVMEHLTCRYVPGQSCSAYMARFLERCYYVSGEYNSRDDFLRLYEAMRIAEGDGAANRLYYMAIPPFLFLDVARALGGAGLVDCDGNGPGWSRAVIEKPFGRDRESSDALVLHMGQVFDEEQTYRIDHYLGKEIIQNLLVLRFANAVFEPLWNRSCIESVRILWKEDIGVEDRGGYYDQYGIIRDVIQNHLLQILALVAMEPPASFDAQHVRDRKVDVLRSMAPVAPGDVVLGQYRAATHDGAEHRAYSEETGVPPTSRTPTYASVVLQVNNARWSGVPFRITAGKGLDEKITEIRIRFRTAHQGLFGTDTAMRANELVIRVQPDETIQLVIMNKVPGLEMRLVETSLDLRYKAAFTEKIPDAYECLLLDVLRGDKSLFIRADELAAAWDVFTPVLHEIEHQGLVPEPYPFGSAGPVDAEALAAKDGAT